MASPEHWHTRRARFWRASLVTSGKATLALLGLLGVIVGGSLVAYLKFAHHRPLVVIVGAVLLIALLVEAAYRRWDEAEREAASLRAERDRDEIGPKHYAQLEALISGFQSAIASAQPCSYGNYNDRRAVERHFPEVVGTLAALDDLVARERAAPDELQALIRREVENAPLPAEFHERIGARLTTLTVGLNGDSGHTLNLNSFNDGPPNGGWDRMNIVIGSDILAVLDGVDPKRADAAIEALRAVFTTAQESKEAGRCR
jgi:hypothetical protein